MNKKELKMFILSAEGLALVVLVAVITWLFLKR